MRLPARLSLTALLLGALAAPVARADEPPPPKETRFFESYDKDLDGRVTQEEFVAGGGEAAAFALLDGNKDGAVCPEELGLPADYKPRPRPEGKRPGEGAPPGPGKPDRPEGGGRGGEMRKKMQEMDADGDGKVARAEWKGPPEAFDRMDQNGDGFLDAQDMPQGGGRPGGAGAMELLKKRWQQMDADGDGKVTREEWKGGVPFERADADGDGVLTDADVKKLAESGGIGPGGGLAREPRDLTPEQLAALFADMDKDANGKIEAAEMPEQARERMLKADTDADGALNKAEFEEGYRKSRRAAKAAEKPGETPKDGPQPAAGAPPPGPGPELLRRFDHDRDGRVTRDQFPGSDEKFAQLDKNGDGVLTADDFPAPPPAPAAPAQGAPAAPGLIAKLDKDGDGRLSRAEFQGSDADWRALDKNADGWIDTDEAAPR